MYIGMNYIEGFCPHRPDFKSVCPATEEDIGLFPQSSDETVNEAVCAAKKAFQSWRKLSRVARAEYFDRLCDAIKRNTTRIVNSISWETGKTMNESLAEVNEALHMAQFTFGMGRMPTGQIVASEIAAKDSYVIRKPKGVVAVISPWNFPFAIAGFWCAAPALLEGNTVVVKPSEETPMIGQIIAELYQEAGFPPGVFNLVHGDGSVGEALADHPAVNHICFTGSATVGTSIKRVCADSWTKTCSCETGSKSAVIVFEDADMNLALSACIASAYKLSGQRCVSSGRLLIQEHVFDEFVARFVEASSKIKVGDSLRGEEDIGYGPMINKYQMDSVLRFNEETKAFPGYIDVLLEGKKLDRKGFFLSPHVYKVKQWRPKESFQGCNKANFLRQEVFGPHVALIPFEDLDEAIHIYNDTEYGLSLGVCTNDFKKARECRDRCEFGLGYWNGGSIAAESHLPFGGVKKSGNGVSSAAGTFDAVVHKVTWTANHGPLAFPQGMNP